MAHTIEIETIACIQRCFINDGEPFFEYREGFAGVDKRLFIAEILQIVDVIAPPARASLRRGAR